MKTLLLLRHAKSSWDDPGLADYERPLNKRGKHDAPHMGELLKEKGLRPDLIISSPARRAIDTARLVADECSYLREILLNEDFYGADLKDFYTALKQVPEEVDCVMFVGHNPDMEMLLSALTGETAPLGTANLAQVELPIKKWQEMTAKERGRLANLWRPKELV